MNKRSVQTAAICVLALLILEPAQVLTQVELARPESEPEVFSVAPLGARQGSTLEAEIRGKNLAGAYGVWVDASGVKGQVKEIHEIELEEKKESQAEAEKHNRGHRIRLELTVEPSARVGMYSLRLVTPSGISNSFAFLVGSELVTAETERSHDKPDLAQSLNFPVVVNGKISQPGELDYYSFDALEGQMLVFEVFAKAAISTLASPKGFDARLAIYEPTGSWFDAKQVTRLAFNDEPASTEHRQTNEFISTNPRLLYRFAKAGRYLVQVASFLGYGGPDCPYLLRIAQASDASLFKGEKSLPQLSSSVWQEHTYNRTLGVDRLQLIASRSVRTAAEKKEEKPTSDTGRSSSGPLNRGATAPKREGIDPALRSTPMDLVEEKEPNEASAQGLDVSLPSMIYGRIDHPDDIDHFGFKVDPGQALAFEIETPRTGPPVFNPWLRVLDEKGAEVVTNLYKRIGRAFTFYNKTVEPKTTYRFERGGHYTLQIRDFSYRHGNSDFVYRIQIRPQVPHVGEIEVCWECSKKPGTMDQKIPVDRINLRVGEARKFMVATELEEGFTGSLAVRVEGLPPGVEAFPGTEVESERSAPVDEGDKEQFVPRRSVTTVLLMAAADARETRTPQLIRISVRPVVDGKIGPLLPVREIPMMLVRQRQVRTADSR